MSIETVQIPIIGNELFATIDAEDFELVSKYKWAKSQPLENGPIYAQAYFKGIKNRIKMHRLITGAKPGEVVIFLDKNGLNNTRANLRLGTRSDSCIYSRRPVKSRSGAKGVSFSKRQGEQRHWRAYIHVEGKFISLGNYASFDEALAARKAAEAKYHGDLAYDAPVGEPDPAWPRKLDVTWFPPDQIHKLSKIDKESKSATCSVCGRVTIRNSGRSGTAWKCINKARETRKKHAQKHNLKRDALRRPYMKFKKDECERCGFEPDHPCQLDVHHQDGNSKNNDPSNLETLCSNCHRLETQMTRRMKCANGQAWTGGRKMNRDAALLGLIDDKESGRVGVSWKQSLQKWQAHINIEGNGKHLGFFNELKDAIAARESAERRYCGPPESTPA